MIKLNDLFNKCGIFIRNLETNLSQTQTVYNSTFNVENEDNFELDNVCAYCAFLFFNLNGKFSYFTGF